MQQKCPRQKKKKKSSIQQKTVYSTFNISLVDFTTAFISSVAVDSFSQRSGGDLLWPVTSGARRGGIHNRPIQSQSGFFLNARFKRLRVFLTIWQQNSITSRKTRPSEHAHLNMPTPQLETKHLENTSVQSFILKHLGGKTGTKLSKTIHTLTSKGHIPGWPKRDPVED